jgi:ankyrin repeat protein
MHTDNSPSSQISVADTGKTALHIAAENGNISTVKLLMNISADVDAQDSNGRTALHLAVEYGHENVVT